MRDVSAHIDHFTQQSFDRTLSGVVGSIDLTQPRIGSEPAALVIEVIEQLKSHRPGSKAFPYVQMCVWEIPGLTAAATPHDQDRVHRSTQIETPTHP
jgi:hypothetical protein